MRVHLALGSKQISFCSRFCFFPWLHCFFSQHVLITEYLETFFRFQTFSLSTSFISNTLLYLLLWLPHTPSFIISSQGDCGLCLGFLQRCNLWAFSRQLVGHNSKVHLIVSSQESSSFIAWWPVS